MGNQLVTRVALVAAALVFAMPSDSSAEAMATKLQTVRKEAKTIVVGTVTVDAKGTPTVQVEYAIRGTAVRGSRVVKKSPDGMIFIDPKLPKRVVVFLDAKDRLRWVGERIAGPTLEHGVIRLHGFYDFNAHIVYPGIVSLAQLRSYLRTGKLEQTFHGTLAFPDGKGGVSRSAHRITMRYDAMARKTLSVQAPKMACLGHPSMSAMAWGIFRLHFHCRKRGRGLTLTGRFDGVDAKTGDIRVSLIPLRPQMYEKEFWTYVGDERATAVDRVLHVKVGGRVWRWRVGEGLWAPGSRRRLRPDGGSVGSRMRGGKTVTYRQYRFGAGAKALIELDHLPRFPRWGSDDFSLVQLVDAKRITHCKIRYKGKVRRCTIKHAPPRWQRASH